MDNQKNVKNYVGVDIGKRGMEILRYKITRHDRIRFRTNREGERNLLQWLKKDDIVVMEAGNQSFRIAKRIMREKGIDVIVLNPGDVATIYQSLKKTDKEKA